MNKQGIGFAIGGIGHNSIYALFSGFMMLFYTDVFGLSPEFTALLFLIARFFDAIKDPIMGVITDSSKSRLGKCRVWLFRSAPFISLFLVLCFWAPNLEGALKGIYCYLTFMLFGIVFSMADIPYWSLPAVLTDSAEERTKIMSLGSFSSSLAYGLGAMAVPIIVEAAPDEKRGYFLCGAIFAVVGLLTYYACALMVREKVAIKREQYSLKKSLKAFVKNKPLLIAMLASFFGEMAYQTKASMTPYYGNYNLGGYSSVSWLSGMLLIGTLIGTAVTPMLARKVGTKNAMKTAMIAGVLSCLLFYVCGYSSFALVMVFTVIVSIAMGSLVMLIGVMTLDTMDYGEYAFGQRNEGMLTSARTFITKLATAVAGAASAYILKVIKYVPNVEQTVKVKNAFHFSMTVLPAAFFLIGLVAVYFYPLSKKVFDELEENLKNKRNAEASE